MNPTDPKDGGLPPVEAAEVRQLLGLPADAPLGDPEFHVYRARKLGLPDDISPDELDRIDDAATAAIAPLLRGEVDPDDPIGDLFRRLRAGGCQ